MSARHLQRRDDPATLLENDDTDLILRAVVRSVFRSQADEWLTERHPSLGGRSPQDCIDEGDDRAVRDLLRRILFAPYA